MWAPLGAQPTPNPTPSPAPLHASLSAALSARAGSVLEYTVTLTDVTAEPVVLDPCPYYVESLGGRVVGNTTPPPGFPSAKPWRGEPIYAGYAKEAYELNCADVQSIPAGGAATFAMRLRVPLDAAGPETLRWHLVVAGRDIETASAPLVIDPAP